MKFSSARTRCVWLRVRGLRGAMLDALAFSYVSWMLPGIALMGPRASQRGDAACRGSANAPPQRAGAKGVFTQPRAVMLPCCLERAGWLHPPRRVGIKR